MSYRKVESIQFFTHSMLIVYIYIYNIYYIYIYIYIYIYSVIYIQVLLVGNKRRF